MSAFIKSITSAANASVKSAAALHLKKQRAETGQFLGEGLRLLQKAHAHGQLPVQLFFDPAHADARTLKPLQEAVHKAGGEVLAVTADILRKITRRENPQSAVGVFRQKFTPLSELKSAPSTLIALEGVRDPGNLGTILRTADAVGAGGMILLGECCDPFSLEAVRASMDSVFALPMIRATLPEFADFAQKFPGSVIGTAVQDAQDYRAARYTAPVLLVMGSEQSGLSAEARRACHTLVKVPMRNNVDSLNLAVATGVMLFHVESAARAA